MPKTKRKKLSEQVRQAVNDSGLTRYRISKETGIGQDTLSRSMTGQRGLTTTALDVLADYLDLNIVVGESTPRKDK